MRKTHRLIVIVSAFLLLGFAYAVYFPQIGTTQNQAEVEFYHAWLLFQDRKFEATIDRLSRALTLNPQFHWARRLLALTFYHTGQTSEAIAEYIQLSKDIPGDLTIKHRIESLMRSQPTQSSPNYQFNRILPRSQGYRYNKPTFVKALPNNQFGVLSLGNLEIGSFLILDSQNEPIENRHRLSGKLEYPMGMAYNDDEIWVTDFKEDKVHRTKLKSGFWKSLFSPTPPLGKPGGNPLEFRSPAGICFHAGNFYIADSGNNRIQIISSEGTFITTFERTGDFDPLNAPFGVYCDQDRLWITESNAARISVFDYFGNIQKEYSPKELKKPRHIEKDLLTEEFLISDEVSGVLKINLQGEVRSLINSYNDDNGKKNYFARVYSAGYDFFGNLFIADYGTGSVIQLIPESDLFQNLDLRIEKINAVRFPQMGVYVAVQDFKGNYLTTLNEKDFRILENDADVGNLGIRYLRQFDNIINTVIIIPRKTSVVEFRGQLQWVFEHIFDKIREKDKYKVISYGTDIRHETDFINSRLKLHSAIQKAADTDVVETPTHLSDAMIEGVQLLLTMEGKKNVIVLSDGTETEEAFKHYSSDRVKQFARANHISIYALALKPAMENFLLPGISRYTNGLDLQALTLNINLDNHMRSQKEVRYLLSYASRQNKELKGQYMDIKVMAKFRSHRGLDYSGFFIPK